MAVQSVDTKLLIGDTTPVEVAGLTSIAGLELTADTIDVTTLSSTGGYREFIAGFKDAGEVSVEGYLELDNGQKQLHTLFESGATEAFTIEFPNGAKWEFDGVVTGFSTSASLEDPLAFSATIKVSGQPTLTIPTP